ncbi:DUF5337 domain-containing protein [Tropicibacter naphthalenivorans]|uniref:Uncharacterized protein n=1 Tax=Tropicibacter naphthalenivorans TaxID=441103 RepID=A0A0P1GF18_9RHOB|nr:DUF5337 domain-containing protein [Tropicibacter naphthalenivorans]CUH80292.1 hypothetical protein TRN7648_02914 [Tropicibacter naphthalenivorans]SMC85751.1 hypothetical protein SAMN04488093_105183 [Tropicibacter naphthalenivorans]
MADSEELNRQGRNIGLLIAGVAVGWVAANALGAALDWSQRTRAFFDLAAGAGFLMAFWMIYGLWRARQKNKD